MRVRGITRHRQLCVRAGAALLFASAAVPTSAFAAELAEQAPEPDILVIGTRYISGIQPERDLDEEAISSYSASTVDGLLAEVQSELGEDQEPPLILVNGERMSGLDDIGALPVEAVDSLKVLPHGSAVQAGGTARQRIISLTLKDKMRSATLLAAHRVATDGDWNADRGEAILTYIEGVTRMNVAFRVRDESDLFEDERGIDQPAPGIAFAQGGNAVGFPDTAAEIDPLLSALAGELVTVAAIPGLANPALADFASTANDPALTDLGRFRTLRPEGRTYDLSGTFATRLAPWLTGNASLRFSQSDRRLARGLPATLFVLPATNPNSPFSMDVGLALYGPEALHTRSRRDSGEATIALNGTFGRWTSHFAARHARSKDETLTQRPTIIGNVPIGDTVDPFDGNLFSLVPIGTDKARGKATTTSALLSASGPAAKLPAGDLYATVEGRFVDNRLRSITDFSGISEKRSFHRSEWAIRGALEVPLIGGGEAKLPGVGELSATAEATITDYSDAGTLGQHAFGLTWVPRPALRFRGEFEEEKSPPSMGALNDPVIVTSGVRVFDPLTGETVDVTQLNGGNPDLDSEKTRTWRIAGLWTLVPRHKLQLNAEYTDMEERNFVSSVPEASAAVMLAFPERFVRDLDGTLTIVDLRPVNFASHREKRFRYGLSLNTAIGGSGPTGGLAASVPSTSGEDDTGRESPSAASDRGSRPLRLQLSANHSIVLEDEISLRPGFGTVDLLDGGAIGIAGGRVRHQFDGSAALSSSGVGVRLGVNWRGKYTLDSLVGGVSDTLRFSPVLAINFRAFADMRRFLPNQSWASGLRLSLNVLNATNDRQEVRDSDGNTPLQYQPGYRDPIGRSVELELRKVF